MSSHPPDPTAPAPAHRSLGDRARRLLASPRAPWVIIAVALLLHLPSLSVGWVLDDHLVRLRIQAALNDAPSPMPVYPGTLWDVFAFAPTAPADKARIIEDGGLVWTTDPRIEFRFFRPLSALTHVVDNLLWPESAALAHLHSLAWLALLFGAVLVLYRRVQHQAWVAGLGLLLYALDDARAASASWISNRNALIAVFFGVLALIAHDCARRDGWRPGRLLAPLAFAVALLAGELGVATLGYLLAHALTLDRAPLRARLLALAPYLLVLVAWAVPYALMGYGVRHSAFYVDPGADPLHFAAAVVTNAPTLLAAQLSGLWSDVCILLPDRALTFIGLGAAIYLLLFLDTARRVVGRSAEARFWGLGALLAAVPSASVVPMDRNLSFIGLGVMGLLACFLAQAHAPATGPLRPLHRSAIRFWVFVLVLANVIGGPLLVPLRATGYRQMEAWVERGEGTLPHVTSGDPTVVAIGPPTDAMLTYAPIVRASLGEPPPGRLRLLATGHGAVTLTREAPDTLLVRLAEPYLALIGERITRRDPFAVGDRVTLSDVVIEVTATTREGWLLESRWRFARPLEDPDTIFLRWSDEAIGFVPFTPPAVGERVTLPAIDMLRAWLGR